MIRLDDLLKRTGIAQTGGHAKLLIQGGLVALNGEVETRRRKQLHLGDQVTVDLEGEVLQIEVDAELDGSQDLSNG